MSYLAALAAPLETMRAGFHLAFVFPASRARFLYADWAERRAQRWRPGDLVAAEEADVPPDAREAIAAAEPQLAALGFVAGAWCRATNPWGGEEGWLRLFSGPGPTCALVRPAWLATPLRPADATFFTMRADGAVLETCYGAPPGTAPAAHVRQRFVLADDVAAQLAAHEAALPGFLAGQAPRVLDAEAQLAGVRAQYRSWVDDQVAAGRMVPGPDGARLTARAAWAQVRIGIRRYVAMEAHAERQAREAAGRGAPPVAEEVAAYRREEPGLPIAPIAATWLRWALLAIALEAGWVGTGLWPRTTSGGLVIAVSLAVWLHAAGQALALRACGLPKETLSFGPPDGLSARRYAACLLAGPLPGLLLGTLMLARYWQVARQAAAQPAWDPVAPSPTLWLLGTVLVAVNLASFQPTEDAVGGKLLELLCVPLGLACWAAFLAGHFYVAFQLRDHFVIAAPLVILGGYLVLDLYWRARIHLLAAALPPPTAGEDRVETAFGLLRDEDLDPAMKRHLVRGALVLRPPLPLWERAAWLGLSGGAIALAASLLLATWPGGYNGSP